MSAEEVRAEDGRAVVWRRLMRVTRAASLVVIAASLLLIARRLPLAAALGALEHQLSGLGGWAPLAFGLVYVLGALLFFPASVLTVAAGALFGPLLGGVVASSAATAAVALAFLIGRYLGRDAVVRLARRHPGLDAVDRAVSADGWKVVALLRLTPAVSFALQNYLYGATGISFRTCVLTSAWAMLPGTLLYVYLGALGRQGVEAAGAGPARSPAEWALLAVGLLATLTLTVYASRLARRALRAQGSVSASAGPAPRGGRPWLTLTLVALALLLAAAAMLVHVHPETLERLLPAAPEGGSASLGQGRGRLIS